MRFLAEEKRRLIDWKRTTRFLSESARADGVYHKKEYPFCLPRERAVENLFPEIRGTAVEYFKEQDINWHHGKDGAPGNHLCGGQVACVNFLMPFADKPEALAQLLKGLYPTIAEPLTVEGGRYVAFEWIGEKNYLREGSRGWTAGQRRTRGANYTSADAAFRFQHQDGTIQAVLVEWKYTERYSGAALAIADSGRDRREIYAHLFEREDCPIDRSKVPEVTDLFYEPFYQFMLKQLLANEMEKAKELNADVVSVLHIAPRRNKDFERNTSPGLKPLGGPATAVWQGLLCEPDRFTSVYTEDLFSPSVEQPTENLRVWSEYVSERYPWVTA